MEFFCTSNEALLDEEPDAATVEPPPPPAPPAPTPAEPPLDDKAALTAPLLVELAVWFTVALLLWEAEMEMLWLRIPPETPAISASVSWIRSVIVSILHLRFSNREQYFL